MNISLSILNRGNPTNTLRAGRLGVWAAVATTSILAERTVAGRGSGGDVDGRGVEGKDEGRDDDGDPDGWESAQTG
jgi:hypothetical protein